MPSGNAWPDPEFSISVQLMGTAERYVNFKEWFEDEVASLEGSRQTQDHPRISGISDTGRPADVHPLSCELPWGQQIFIPDLSLSLAFLACG